jgi:O-methyltransferase involved in polyketide biosynthesis
LTEAKLTIELQGVPETLLWTLYHRALEARRPDRVLDDPKAVELVEAIDYPFAERFGTGDLGKAQWQGLRARCFDEEVRRFLREHPGGTVVALGEGLETQFWRVDDGRVAWLSVDLPETVAVRGRLLPSDSRLRTLSRSALDPGWMEEVDHSRGVLITAQGLLMYFEPAYVHRLIAACPERFPGGALLFDAVSRWLSERSRRGALADPGGFRPPPWLWGIDAEERHRIATIPGVAALRELRLPRGRGAAYGLLIPLASRLPVVRAQLFSVLLATFAGGRGAE